jgi:hypothetical protein
MHGKKRNAYRVLVGKSEQKGALGRCRHRLTNIIRTDLKEELNGRWWTGLIWLKRRTSSRLF